MSRKGESATNDGQNGSSGYAGQEQDEMEVLARILGDLIADHHGGLTPEARDQIKLRDDGDRAKVLEELVRDLTPSEVSPGLWLRWLKGGDSPFGSKGLKRPVRLAHGVGKELARSPSSLRAHRERVEKARAELAYAEETLAYHEAMDKSLLEWCVSDHLIRLLAPIFSMGPAWTLMRSVSSYMSDEEADELTRRSLDKNEKGQAIAWYRSERLEESEDILEGLDFFSGHFGFERALRAAILKVVRDFAPRREDWTQSGRRRRSKAARNESAHPGAQIDRDKVLEGLKRSD